MAPPDDPVRPPAGPVRPPAEGPSRIGLAAGVAVTLMAVAVAVVFGLSRADDPGRIVLEVVALHDRGSDGPPPAGFPDPGPRDGFADFATRAHWVPSGTRVDRVEGRLAATVFWDRLGRRVAYTTVSGSPVDAPGDARRTGRRGVLLRSFDRAGRTAVTWDENGHTAVISAIGISRAALYNLAGGRRPAALVPRP
jgi:YD repeat-containing protein